MLAGEGHGAAVGALVGVALSPIKLHIAARALERVRVVFVRTLTRGGFWVRRAVVAELEEGYMEVAFGSLAARVFVLEVGVGVVGFLRGVFLGFKPSDFVREEVRHAVTEGSNE